MDFTSDSRQSTATIPGDDGSDEPSSDVVLKQDDLHLINLLNDKEKLISQRNALLEEIAHYTSQLEKPSSSDRQISLQDLLASVTTENSSHVITVDGNSSTLLELAHKHDTLPLLNMDARLLLLQEKLYPNVSLRLDGDTLFATYTLMEPHFTIELLLQYASDTLTECKLISVSDAVKWQLRSLLSRENPTEILLGCFEFDRVRCRVSAALDSLCGNLDGYSQVSLSREQFSIECTRKDLRLALRVTFQLEFAFVVPTTDIVALLSKDGKYIDVDEIKLGLIKEYGINVGLLQLCKTCLNL